MKWAPEYINTILIPGFNMMKTTFAEPMLKISSAHVVMLHHVGILSLEDSALILKRCEYLLKLDWKTQEYPGNVEDLFFLIEQMIEEQVGPDVAGNMHIAMSRNDLDTAMYRWVLRKEVLDLGEMLIDLRSILLSKAYDYAQTIMPAHTHNQQAQPTTVGHYLSAVEANLARDHQRLLQVYSRINCSPLGACALATTGFPIDRDFTAALLGFSGLVENSYDAICTTDYMAEFIGLLGTILTTLSRFVSDLLLWATNEFDVIKLPDEFVQRSSIMPQKRNPSGLEHLRAHIGRAIGKLGSFYTTVKGIPFGDAVDSGDDIQPVLRGLWGDTSSILRLLTSILQGIRVNERVLWERTCQGFSVITELADALARSGLSFREAHKIASLAVDKLFQEGSTLPELTLSDLDTICIDQFGKPSGLTKEAFQQAIDPSFFVETRRVAGGPSSDVLLPFIERADKRIEVNKHDIWSLHQELHEGDQLLNNGIAAILKGGN